MAGVFRNVFSWSPSRDGVFRECPRKYYFHYYGYWGGWEWDAPKRIREIYILRKLKSRALWVGEVVHDCIARSLKNLSRGIPVIGLDEILSITRDRMRSDYRNSRSGAYRSDPTGSFGFFEHEYEVPTKDEEWKQAADRVDLCLKSFYGSEYFQEFSSMGPDSFLEIEEFSQFELEGAKVTLRIDLATRSGDRVMVWDWKTGKSGLEGPTLQMACYAYHAGRKYGVDPKEVVTRLVELPSLATYERKLSSKAIEEFFSYVRGSIKDMVSLLDDPQKNIASEERFVKVEKPNVCLSCNFLKVCKPNI